MRYITFDVEAQKWATENGFFAEMKRMDSVSIGNLNNNMVVIGNFDMDVASAICAKGAEYWMLQGGTVKRYTIRREPLYVIKVPLISWYDKVYHEIKAEKGIILYRSGRKEECRGVREYESNDGYSTREEEYYFDSWIWEEWREAEEKDFPRQDADNERKTLEIPVFDFKEAMEAKKMEYEWEEKSWKLSFRNPCECRVCGEVPKEGCFISNLYEGTGLTKDRWICEECISKLR